MGVEVGGERGGRRGGRAWVDGLFVVVVAVVFGGAARRWLIEWSWNVRCCSWKRG